jgi:hypothetical protein
MEASETQSVSVGSVEENPATALTSQIGEDDHHGMRQALPNLPLHLPSLTNHEDNAQHIPYHFL